MPTDETLAEYGRKLPKIYQEILTAFPRIEPNRKAGFGLAYQSMADDLENRGAGFTLGEIMQACEQMAARQIVSIKNRFVVQPTEYGERLISVMTGHRPAAIRVPDLPPPPAQD